MISNFFLLDIKKLRKIIANRITKIKVYQNPLKILKKLKQTIREIIFSQEKIKKKKKRKTLGWPLAERHATGPPGHVSGFRDHFHFFSLSRDN